MTRVLQAEKWNFEKSQKRLKIAFLGLKMIIFGHFSRFLAAFKISFSSLQHPNYDELNSGSTRHAEKRRRYMGLNWPQSNDEYQIGQSHTVETLTLTFSTLNTAWNFLMQLFCLQYFVTLC